MNKEYNLIIEIGNSRTKVCLFSLQEDLVKKIHFPSYIYEKDQMQYSGHFTMNGKDYLIGESARRLEDSEKLTDIPNGKTLYMNQFICAAVTHLQDYIEHTAQINVYIIGLVNRKKEDFNKQLQEIKKLKIDGVDYSLTFKFINFRMEGIGGIYQLIKQFPEEKYFSSIDMGDGTTILGTYSKTKNALRSVPIEPYETGTNDLINRIIKKCSSKIPPSKLVDRDELYDSLFNNKYKYMSRGKSEDIRKETYDACVAWLNSKYLRGFLSIVRQNLKDKIYTLCIGGGWNIELLRDAFKSLLLDFDLTKESIEKYLIFREKDSREAGFNAVCELIMEENGK